MNEKARAAVLVAPGRYEIQEFSLPNLEDGGLLMKVEMAGICGTDKHTYQGETKQYAGTAAEMDTPFPIIQGHELAKNQYAFVKAEEQIAAGREPVTFEWSPDLFGVMIRRR